MRSTILVLLLAALTYTIYTNFFHTRALVNVGDTAPDFALKDLEGNTFQLSDYRGKGVFLNFWGTWCPPCEKEMPYMENQYQFYQDKGVEIIAVNIQETDVAVRSFRDRYGLTFPIPIDKTGQVRQAYGIKPIPTTFLIDENGEVVKIITTGMTERMVQESMELILPNNQ